MPAVLLINTDIIGKFEIKEEKSFDILPMNRE